MATVVLLSIHYLISWHRTDFEKSLIFKLTDSFELLIVDLLSPDIPIPSKCLEDQIFLFSR